MGHILYLISRLLQHGDASLFPSNLFPWHLRQRSRLDTWLQCPLPLWWIMWCMPATERWGLPKVPEPYLVCLGLMHAVRAASFDDVLQFQGIRYAAKLFFFFPPRIQRALWFGFTSRPLRSTQFHQVIDMNWIYELKVLKVLFMHKANDRVN